MQLEFPAYDWNQLDYFLHLGRITFLNLVAHPITKKSLHGFGT